MMQHVYYGGQAVMEGVMMRGQHGMAVAVRDADGRILLHAEPIADWPARSWLSHWPLVRGVVVLADAVRLGMHALLFSASVGSGQPAAPTDSRLVWRALAVSVSFAVGMFFLLPLGLVLLVDRFIPSALASNLLEGGLRLGLLVGYLLLIGRQPEARRLFGYHGAEHKTINAFEAGAELTPASVRRFGLVHPRCGTGFLLVLVMLSVVVFALLGRPALPLRVASRLLLLPVIATIGFEYVRLTADFYRFRLARLLAWPSLALQRLSTREPDDAMLEVAIAALRHVLANEPASGSATTDRSGHLVVEASRAAIPLAGNDG